MADEISPTAHRPTWAEISLDNLLHNFRTLRALLGFDVAIMPAVKADAYGHGAVECAQALESEGAEWFGVALPEEAVELRDAGISRPILCLGGFWEDQEALMVERVVTPVVFRLDLLERLDAAAKAARVVADYHLKVDTGMRRLGLQHEALDGFLDRAEQLRNVRLDGLMTHFSSADDPSQSEFTRRQTLAFEEVVARIRARGHEPAWIHKANSAGAHGCPRGSCNLVRPGGILYGLWRDSTNPSVSPLDLRPVMSVRTRVMLVKTLPAGTPLGYGGTFVTSRPSRIATIAIGYADGFRRGLSNRGTVLIGGRRAPVVGRVSMDLTLIDVTDLDDVEVGAEAVIIGGAPEGRITAEEMAGWLGTLSYEVTCGISKRVQRIYGRTR